MQYYKVANPEEYQYIASLFKPGNNEFLIRKKVSGEKVEKEHQINEHIHTFILENGGERIGWFSLKYNPKTRNASFGMIIDLPFQGNGFGIKAVQIIEYEAQKLGAIKLELDVFINNERAIRLYEKAGFKPIRTMLRMEKEII